MAKLPTLVIFLLIYLPISYSQNEHSVERVAIELKQMEIFQECQRFKDNFEEMASKAGSRLLYTEDYAGLNAIYNEVQGKYNNFLGSIKRDLSDWKTIRQMVKRPQKFAADYQQEYHLIADSYQDNFIPVYNRIMDKADQTKSIVGAVSLIEQILMFDLSIFEKIVGAISNRREEKQKNLNAILAEINQHFDQNLHMRSWAELGIEKPTQTQLRPVPANESVMMIPAADNLNVPPPVFEELNGWIEINFLNTADQPQRMVFQLPGGGAKNLIIESGTSENGQVVRKQANVNIQEYSSQDRFAEGTRFQLKTSNSAAMYVLTQNSDGSVAVLYPFGDTFSSDCNPKNLVIGDERAAAPITTIPPPNCATNPPSQRYITISGPNSRETLCVLLTRSDLNRESLKAELNAVPGDLNQRLAAVFGDQLITPAQAGLTMQDNRIQFSAAEVEKNVLPVVLYINR